MASRTRSVKRKSRGGAGTSSGRRELEILRVPIPERGFDLSAPEMSAFQAKIERLEWGKLCKPPKNAVLPLVREFYNSQESYKAKQQTIKVRGVRVSISAETLNAFYRLEAPEIDEYEQVMAEFPAEEILRTLTKPGSAWILSSKNEPIAITGKSLTTEPRVWLRFVSANLIPGTNVSRITRERAALIYCILQEKQIDVGKLLHKNLCKSLFDHNCAMWYPSMVFALCKQAQVPWTKAEELTHPQLPIDHLVIRKMEIEDVPGPSASPATSKTEATAPRPAPNPAHGPVPVPATNQWEQLLQAVAEQQLGLVRLTSMVRQLMIHAGLCAEQSESDAVPPYADVPYHAMDVDQQGEEEVLEGEAETEDVLQPSHVQEEEQLILEKKRMDEEAEQLRLQEEAAALEAAKEEAARVAAREEEERELRELADAAEQAMAAAQKAAAEAAEMAAAACAAKAAAAQASAEQQKRAADYAAKGKAPMATDLEPHGTTPSRAVITALSPIQVTPLRALPPSVTPATAVVAETGTPAADKGQALAISSEDEQPISGRWKKLVRKQPAKRKPAPSKRKATSAGGTPKQVQPTKRSKRLSDFAAIKAMAEAMRAERPDLPEKSEEEEHTSVTDETDDEPADEIQADSDSS